MIELRQALNTHGTIATYIDRVWLDSVRLHFF